jgi:hypothetical protein
MEYYPRPRVPTETPDLEDEDPKSGADGTNRLEPDRDTEWETGGRSA